MNRIRRQFSQACNHLKYKVIFLGDFGVGKTTLFTWLKDGEPPDTNFSISNCVGIDKCSIPFTLQDGQEVQMEFWDTAGSERYRTLTKNYYRLCSAVVLVYDASDPSTLSSLKDWIEDAKRYAPSNVTFMLLANKYDLQDSAASQDSQLGEAFADLHGIPLYFKISARNGQKDLLLELFSRLAEYIHSSKTSSSKGPVPLERFQPMQEEFNSVSLSTIDDQLLQKSCYRDSKFGKKLNCASCSKR